MARLVFGLPTYRSEQTLGPVIESLLAQDFAELAVVAVDDASPDRTLEIARRYAERDPRVIVEANSERLGMIANWNRTLEIARERFPGFEYFAFASDNDLREPEWASALVRELEADPDAALAYSRFGMIDEQGRKAPAEPGRLRFETRGIASPGRRFVATLDGMRAGPVMYGLHRRRTLDAVVDVPPMLASDVLFLSYLSLYGAFVQAPETLWYRDRRRVTGGMKRVQRAALFAHPPRAAYLPVPIQHTYWLFRRLLVEGRRPPGMGVREALWVVLAGHSLHLVKSARRMVRIAIYRYGLRWLFDVARAILPPRLHAWLRRLLAGH